jgi:arginine-tRNA-protein transferase
MKSVFRYVAPASQCGYLPGQVWRLEYEHVAALTPTEYARRLLAGWRRFGYVLFRPRCPKCTACRSLRVLVNDFRPNRSQRRAIRRNEGAVELRIGTPEVTKEKLALYDRYHAYQTEDKGWPSHPAKDAGEYAASFVHNPFPTQEWCYHVGGNLVGVGYVDQVPQALSAIYFFYDPGERERCLGTLNVLKILERANHEAVPYLYLGYYVAGCRSMLYKAQFAPNQILEADGDWTDFRQ